MLVLAISGVLVGFAFLVISFVTQNSTWAWGCIAACVAAALVLFIDARSRRSGPPTASTDAVGAPVQRLDPLVEVGIPRDDSASDVATTTAAEVLEVRTGQPNALRPDLPAPNEASAEPELVTASEPVATPEPVAVSAPVIVPAVRIVPAVPVPAAVPAAEAEPRPEAAPALVAPGPVHDEVPVPPVATDVETDEHEADAAAPLVAGLERDVLVVDEHPQFHLPGCTWLIGRETMILPAREAVELGFTPCSRCSPERTLAAPARA